MNFTENNKNRDASKVNFDSFLLKKTFTNSQYQIFMNKIEKQMKKDLSYSSLLHLKELKKVIEARHNMNNSQQIANNFLKDFIYSRNNKKRFNRRPELDFTKLEEEVKKTTFYMQKKKYNQDGFKRVEQNFKKSLESRDKKKRRKIMCASNNEQLKTVKNIYDVFVRDKTQILKNYLSESDLELFEQTLACTLRKVQSNNEKKQVSHKMKQYIISHGVLQKIFEMIYSNTLNIQIKHENLDAYMKMKAEMISVLTNEDLFMEKLKDLREMDQTKQNHCPILLKKNHSHLNNIKKHFFSNEKEKVDLTTQIEEAFEAANKIMKEAFLRKNRPDLAEELREVMKSGEGVEAG